MRQDIQALRGLAVALVVLDHIGIQFLKNGYLGVDIFFAISGVVMVISSSLLASNAAGAKEFMSRRLLRILPLYWLVTAAKVAIALALPATVNHNHFDLVHAVKSFLFIPAFNAEGDIRPIHGVGWTLLHEMFFYLVFAAMMWMGRRPALWSSLAILTLIVFGQWMPPASAAMQVACNPINLYFILGMLIGAATLAGWRSPKSTAVVVGSLLAALAKWAVPGMMAWLPLDPIVLLLGCLMLGLAAWTPPRWMNGLVSLGDSSYALYLFHPMIAPPALMVVHKLAPSLGPVGVITLTAVAAIAVSHAIHLLVELRLNRWAKRCFKPRRPTAPSLENPA